MSSFIVRRMALFNSTPTKKWLVSHFDTNHFSVQQLS